MDGPLVPAKDYLAIFYSMDCDDPEIQRHISNMFPGASLVGYRDSGQFPAGTLSKSEDGQLVVHLPMPSYLGRHLFEDFAAIKAQRNELLSVQRRADEIQDFFDSVYGYS